jgi:hypothetical protein
LAEKSCWDRQTDGKNLVWLGEIERKLAKLPMTTFAYRSSSELFYGCSTILAADFSMNGLLPQSPVLYFKAFQITVDFNF